jgi:hypothetical protein
MHVLLISTLWLLRHRMSTLWLLRHRLYFESQSSSCCMSTKLYTAWMSTYKCTNTYIHIHTYTYIHTYMHRVSLQGGEGHLRCKLTARAPLPPPRECLRSTSTVKAHQLSRILSGQGIHTHMHAYMHSCIHIHTYTCINAYIYIHIHALMHTYT